MSPSGVQFLSSRPLFKGSQPAFDPNCCCTPSYCIPDPTASPQATVKLTVSGVTPRHGIVCPGPEGTYNAAVDAFCPTLNAMYNLTWNGGGWVFSDDVLLCGCLNPFGCNISSPCTGASWFAQFICCKPGGGLDPSLCDCAGLGPNFQTWRVVYGSRVAGFGQCGGQFWWERGFVGSPFGTFTLNLVNAGVCPQTNAGCNMPGTVQLDIT